MLIDVCSAIPWLKEAVGYLVRSREEQGLVRHLENIGFVISVIEGSKIKDYNSFFHCVLSALNCDKDGNENSHYIYNLLMQTAVNKYHKIAFVWRDFDVTCAANFNISINGVFIIKSASDEIKLKTIDGSCDSQIELFLFGNSADFISSDVDG